MAGAPKAEFARFGDADDPQHRFFQAEREEQLGAVGAELDSGADFAEFMGLFVDAHAMAALHERQCRGQAAEAGARDQNRWFHPANAFLSYPATVLYRSDIARSSSAGITSSMEPKGLSPVRS